MAKEYEQKIDVINTVNAFVSPNIHDPFDATLAGWSTSGTGSDWTAETVAAAAYRGASGLRLQTRATTPAIGDTVLARKTIAKIQSKYITTKIILDTLGGDFIMRVVDYSQSGLNAGGLLYDRSTNTIGYETALDTYATAITINQAISEFTQIGIILDMVRLEYVRMILGSKFINLSNIPLWNTGDGELGEHIQVDLRVTADTAAQKTQYIDDFICFQE